MAKYLNLAGLQTLWEKIKSFFALKENGVYYVPGTSGYANWSANTAYAVGANVVSPYGECWTCKTAHTSGSSWASTNWNRISAVALTGTIDGVTALYAGLKIAYRFQVLGGEGSTTLNVNNLGAKTITRGGAGAFYRWTIGRNGVAILVYDGSAWRFGDYDSNDQYVLPDAYCSTAAGTQAKAATSTGFSYSRHNNIPFRIYFTAANTYNGNLTMDVNSQGAKPLWINGSASSSSNKTIAVGVYWCYYDGTQFQLWTDKSIWGLKFRGDGSNLTEAFTTASSRSNIATGESNATIFGKIAKWFSDLKALAFKDKVSDSDINGTISDSHIASASTWNAKSNLALGETSTTAYRGDRGKTAYDHSQATHAPTTSKTAASGGTDLSLVTTGEKYTWNSKSDSTHTHSVKINGSTKTIAAPGGSAVDLGTFLNSRDNVYISRKSSIGFATSDTHWMRVCQFKVANTSSYQFATVLISNYFWNGQHNLADLFYFGWSNDGSQGLTFEVTRGHIGGSTGYTYKYLKDTTNNTIDLYVYVTGGNSYGDWTATIINSNANTSDAYLSFKWETNSTDPGSSAIYIPNSMPLNITGSSGSCTGNAATASAAQTGSALETAINGKVPKTTVTSLADWNTLNETGIYAVESQASNVAHSPESGKLACYVTVAAGYVTQLAVGDKVYKRCMPATTQVWESWVALQDSSGLTVNELYTTSAGGYIDIHGATIEAGGPAGTTEISGGGITTPKVNGIALNMQTDTAAAIPASANDKLNDVTHLLVNGNKTLKLSEMVENKSYVFHVVSNGAVVSVYNDSSSAYTVRHRGSNISLAIKSLASLNSSTDPAGEIWLARIGTNIYMSKSCEAGTVQDSLKWNGYSLSLGGTPTAGSGTIYFT